MPAKSITNLSRVRAVLQGSMAALAISRVRAVLQGSMAALAIIGCTWLLTGLDRFRLPSPRAETIEDHDGLAVILLFEAPNVLAASSPRLVFSNVAGGLRLDTSRRRIRIDESRICVLPTAPLVFVDADGRVTTSPDPLDPRILKRFLDLRQSPPQDFRHWIQKPEVRKDLRGLAGDLEKFWTPAS